MRAAILVNINEPLVVSELNLPRELSYGQVHVEVLCSGICGSQLGEISGIKGPDKYLPHLLGHEGSGRVLRVGPGVTRIKEGDHVVLHWRLAAGIQAPTPIYDWNGSKVNAGWVTTFNTEAVVSENRLTPIPQDFDLKLAPLFGCALTTAVGVVNRDAQVQIGQSVVILGLGGLGLNIAQACSMVSAWPIIGVDIVESKVQMASKWGVSHGLMADNLDRVREVIGSEGADIVIDTTGKAKMIELAYELTAASGRTVLVGVPSRDDLVRIHTLPLHFNKILKGSHGGNSVPDIDIPRLIRLCQNGRLKLDGLYTHEYPLEDINMALDALRSGEAGRILLVNQ